MDKIPSIDDMPNLSKRLGIAGCDRIRYAGKADPRPKPRSTNLANPLINIFPDVMPPRVMDILRGASNLSEHHSRPLSVRRMVTILQCVPMINTREVSKMLNISERVARMYVRALVFAYPFIEKEFDRAA